MTQSNAPSSSNPSSFTTPLTFSSPRDRCRHTFPSGRRCRIPAVGASGLCGKHQQEEAAQIAATLTANLDDFTSPEQINTFLSRLLVLLAQDKISTRRAAVLTYIASQLLRTLPAIEAGTTVEVYSVGRDYPSDSYPSNSNAAPALLPPEPRPTS